MIQWRIADLKNDVKFAIKKQIEMFATDEIDEMVQIMVANDVRRLIRQLDDIDDMVVQVLDIMFVRDDLDEHRIDVIDETVDDDDEEVVVMITVVDDEAVVDDEVEDIETGEMVDDDEVEHIQDETVENDEIVDCGENDDNDEKHEVTIIDEVVEWRIHEIDSMVEHDAIKHIVHKTPFDNDEVVENEFIAVETVDIHNIEFRENDETQSRTFIDSIWTQGIFGIITLTQDDEIDEMRETLSIAPITQILDETVQMVDKWLFLMIACLNNDVST